MNRKGFIGGVDGPCAHAILGHAEFQLREMYSLSLSLIIYILPFLDIYRMPSLRHPQLPIFIMCLHIQHHGQVKGKSKNMFRKSASFQDWAEFLMHHRP